MTTKTKTLAHLGIMDAALLTLACLIPAASHLFAFPLYIFNPMLALLLAAILLGRDWRNALLMAVLLPAVSCLLTGMPTAGKMICMMAELATVAAVFSWLKTKWSVLPAILVAILTAKAVYYGMKALVLAPAVLVDTQWSVQLLAVLAWGGLFSLLNKRLNSNA